MPNGVSAASSATVLWFLPTHGDGHYLGTARGARAVDLSYLTQLAQAADSLGYYGVLIPTGKSCEDSWLVAAAMVPLTRQLRYLVAVRPGLQPPTLAARMTATLDRLSDGRALINVVTGGDPVENRGDGILLGHAERYKVTREFLQIYKRLLCWRDGRLPGPAYPGRGRPAAVPAGPAGRAAALVRRLVGGGQRGRGRHDRQVPDLGRATGAGCREDGEACASWQRPRGRQVSFGIRLHVIVRRHQRGGLGGGRAN